MENEEFTEETAGETGPVNAEPKWLKILNLTGSAIMMNLTFILCCIPIVTIGQAWCGIFSAIRYTVRGDGWFDGFKVGFKTRFLRGTVAWVICAAADIYLGAKVVFNGYYQWEGNLPALILQCVLLLIAMMFTASLIPLNVYIPTGKLQWIKNAVTLTFTAPWQTALLAILMWIPAGSIVLMGIDAIFFVIFVVMFLIVYFAVTALVGTVLLKDPLIRVKKEMEAMEADE